VNRAAGAKTGKAEPRSRTTEKKAGTARSKAGTTEPNAGTAQPEARTTEKKAAATGSGTMNAARPTKTTPRGLAAKAGPAGEGATPARDVPEPPKTRATRQTRAKAAPATPTEVTAPVQTTTGPTETKVQPFGESTIETTVTVDLRAPEPPASLPPATGDLATAETERAQRRPPARTGGVVAPTRAPGRDRAGTQPVSTAPAATRPSETRAEEAKPAGEAKLAEKAKLTEPAGEAKLAEEATPAEPAGKAKLAEETTPAEPAGEVERAELAQERSAAGPVGAAKAAKLLQGAKTAGLVEEAGAAAPVKGARAAARPVEPARPATPVEKAKPARAAEGTEPADIRTVDSANGRTLQAHRRRTLLLVFVMVAIVVVVLSLFVRRHGNGPSTAGAPAASQIAPAPPAVDAAPSATAKAKAAPPADAATTGPRTASGKFTQVAGYGPLMGTNGPLRRFRVAVESSIGQGNGGDFADEIDSTLGDPRSWITGRDVRLQRVPQQAAAEFTIYLASAPTSQRMCAAGGLATKGYTSCRLPGQVIINEDRWQNAVPGYGAPLATYRAYVINHEVGHQLGHGHEACPGDGQLAPVMQQQTYGLNGCVAYAWPYLEGKRYAGPPTQ
jgi:Protein of unknown function (DUF3152)